MAGEFKITKIEREMLEAIVWNGYVYPTKRTSRMLTKMEYDKDWVYLRRDAYYFTDTGRAVARQLGLTEAGR